MQVLVVRYGVRNDDELLERRIFGCVGALSVYG